MSIIEDIFNISDEMFLIFTEKKIFILSLFGSQGKPDRFRFKTILIP